MLRTSFCILSLLLAPVISSVRGANPSGTSGWTVHLDFNEGVEGEKVEGMSAAGRTIYTTEHSFEGGQAVAMHARRGREEFGRWGGIIEFPKHLHKGDEVWWRVYTFWPRGVDYSASPRLKFLRIHTSPAGGGNLGYNDIYLNSPGSKVPLQFIYEGAHKWSMIGDRKHAVKPGVWECYEYYLKLGDKSVDGGGEARVRFWKDGRLIADITDRITLKEADGYADGAFLFTYWNSSPWVGQMIYEGDQVGFREGELVSSDTAPEKKYEITRVGDHVLYIRDPQKDWRKRARPCSQLKRGDVLTGMNSGASCTLSEVLHTHPVMDIKMYVDEVTLTNETPGDRDEQGNPYLGLSARPGPPGR